MSTLWDRFYDIHDLFVDEETYYIESVWIYYDLFIQFPIEGQLSCFQFLHVLYYNG